MYWYKLGEGQYSSSIEIIIGSEKQYTNEMLVEIVEEVRAEIRKKPNDSMTYETQQVVDKLIEKHGFMDLPLAAEYYLGK